MSLSCSCGGSLDEYAYMHEGPSEFQPFNESGEYKRRKRCAACGKLLDFGEDCIRFERIRAPRGEYEQSRFGDEVGMPPVFQCEKCAQIFIPLWEMGYTCMSPDVPVQEYLAEYWEKIGFDPKKYKDAP